MQPFWGHSGLVAVHVGSYEYTFDAIAAFDRIIVDHWGEFKHTSLKSLFRMYRAGRLKESDVWADLTDLVLERKFTGPGDRVFVNVFGLSIFDVAVSARTLRTAERMGVGRTLPLIWSEGKQAVTHPIVSTDWVLQHWHDDDLVLVDVRPAEAYAAERIRGARHASIFYDYFVRNTDPDGIAEMNTHIVQVFARLGIAAMHRSLLRSGHRHGRTPGPVVP